MHLYSCRSERNPRMHDFSHRLASLPERTLLRTLPSRQHDPNQMLARRGRAYRGPPPPLPNMRRNLLDQVWRRRSFRPRTPVDIRRFADLPKRFAVHLVTCDAMVFSRIGHRNDPRWQGGRLGVSFFGGEPRNHNTTITLGWGKSLAVRYTNTFGKSCISSTSF